MLYFVDCKAFHVASCDVFLFLIQRTKWRKADMQKWATCYGLSAILVFLEKIDLFDEIRMNIFQKGI